jgi:hypothetical protein
MKKDTPIQYDSLPDISKDFVNEMQWRSMSAMGAMRIFDISVKETHKEYFDYQSIPNITLSFAISQIASLIDGRGKLSIKVSKSHEGRYLVDKGRFKKLLPSLSDAEFLRIYNKVSNLFIKNEKLVGRILYTRHNRIAHASISSHSTDNISLSPKNFPKKQFLKFLDQFESIAYQIIFGIELK